MSWIKRFILFHGKRHPRDMCENEISAFLTDLAVNRNVSASTQNQAFNALLFLYRNVLQMEFGELENVERAKRPKRLPVVFTKEEIKKIIGQLEAYKWIMAQLMYGAGLRVMECVRLRVKDIDFGYRQILVRDGKGQKDHITMLPEIVSSPLKIHLEKVKDVSTTMLYTHVLNKGGRGVQSPGDMLWN